MDAFIPELFRDGEFVNRVDLHHDILGNKMKERALLHYCKEMGIKFLALYDIENIFKYSADDPAKAKLRSHYEDALVSFIEDAEDADVDVGLVLHDHAKQYEDNIQFKSNGRTAGNEIKFSKQDLMDSFGTDTLFTSWPEVKELIDNIPKTDVETRLFVFKAYQIRKFIQERLIEADIIGTQGTRPREPQEVVENHIAIVTEYEWWRQGYETVKPSNNLEESFNVAFLRYLDFIKGLSVDNNGNSLYEIYHYQGSRLPTVTGTYNSSNDLSNFQYWMSNIIARVDKILLTNYVNKFSEINNNTTEHIDYITKVIVDEIKNENNGYTGNNSKSVIPLFSAESNKYVWNDNKEKELFFGDHLNTAEGESVPSVPGETGKTISQIEEEYFRKWYDEKQYHKLDQNTVFKNPVYMDGAMWYTYGEMPHMIYSQQEKQIGKIRDFRIDAAGNRINDPGLRGVRHDYYPNYNDGSFRLELFNTERDIANTNIVDNRDAGFNYEWYSTDHTFSSSPTIIPGETNPTLNVATSTDGWFYVKTVDSDNCSTLSPPVRVQHYSSDFPHIRDTDDDDGSVPNNRTEVLWDSPDISVNDSPTQFEVDVNQNRPKAGQDNYVHVKIRNNGTVDIPANSYRISVYFSRANTDHSWPESWIVREDDQGNIIGDRINQGPYYLWKKIDAGGVEQFDIKWPEEHFPEEDILGNANSENRHYCILVRIIRSENRFDYGMNAQEVSGTWFNVRDNNTVALKNIALLKSNEIKTHSTVAGTADIIDVGFSTRGKAGTSKSTDNIPLGFKSTLFEISNTDTISRKNRLTFNSEIDADIFQNGKVAVNLGRDLFQRWKAGGFKGAGVDLSPLAQLGLLKSFNSADTAGLNELLGTDSELITTIVLDSSGSWIGGLNFQPKETFRVALGMQVDSNVLVNQNFSVDLVHYKEAGSNLSVVGGQRFKLEHLPCESPVITETNINNDIIFNAAIDDIEAVVQYYWLRDGVRIVDEQTTVLRPFYPGSYTFYARSYTGCEALSEPVEFSPDSLSSVKRNDLMTEINPNLSVPSSSKKFSKGLNDSFSISIFPNPVSDVLQVLINSEESLEFTLYNSLGQKVLGMELIKGKHRESIDLTGLDWGFYVLSVKSLNNDQVIFSERILKD